MWQWDCPPLNWLGRQDSNLRMPVPKTSALPLGYAPIHLLWMSAHIMMSGLITRETGKGTRFSLVDAGNRAVE
jgi:hypothetical protein